MFTIVTHNAIGTVHSFIRGFDSVEQAYTYRERYGHMGVGFGSPIIRAADENRVREINDIRETGRQGLYV